MSSSNMDLNYSNYDLTQMSSADTSGSPTTLSDLTYSFAPRGEMPFLELDHSAGGADGGDLDSALLGLSQLDPNQKEELAEHFLEEGVNICDTGTSGHLEAMDNPFKTYETLQCPPPKQEYDTDWSATSGQHQLLDSLSCPSVPLPDSPSKWEDYNFRFDAQTSALTIQPGGMAIKQEVPDTPLDRSPCAFTNIPDVKGCLKNSIRRRRASKGLGAEVPTWTPTEDSTGRGATGHVVGVHDVVRKERRREQNRRAAQKCREKKRRIQNIRQKDYETAMQENRERRLEVNQLKEQVARLERALHEHTATCVLAASLRTGSS